MNPRVDTVVLDLDGTLVDSVYVHTLAWHAAFRDAEIEVAAHRVHRAIGMGGDRLVTHVAGEAAERSVGDDVRRQHARHLDDRFHEIVPLPGALDLLSALADRSLTLVLASSGDRDTTMRLLDLVEGADALLDHILTGSDADSSKPAGDLVEAALHSAGSDSAVMVGDAVWDAHAAGAAGVPVIGLLTGGFSEAELREAGCADVYDSAADLCARLDESLLGPAHASHG